MSNINQQREASKHYDYLANLLAVGMWQKADEQTAAMMLKISHREVEGWLREEDITKFPCFDLESIDELWLKYSKGRFGFSTQSRLWKSVGEDYDKFRHTIGWCDNFEWRKYSHLQFDLQSPVGHLPAAPFYKYGSEIAIGWAVTLVSKLSQCLEESF